MISYSGLKDRVYNFCREMREDPFSSRSSDKLFVSIIGGIGLLCALGPIGSCISEHKKNCAKVDYAVAQPAVISNASQPTAIPRADKTPAAAYYDLSSMLLSPEEQMVADIIRPDDEPIFEYQRISMELDQMAKRHRSDDDPYELFNLVYKHLGDLSGLIISYP